MNEFVPCPDCRRHLRTSASDCHFCGRRSLALRAALPFVALVGLSGCPTVNSVYAGPPTPEPVDPPAADEAGPEERAATPAESVPQLEQAAEAEVEGDASATDRPSEAPDTAG